VVTMFHDAILTECRGLSEALRSSKSWVYLLKDLDPVGLPVVGWWDFRNGQF